MHNLPGATYSRVSTDLQDNAYSVRTAVMLQMSQLMTRYWLCLQTKCMSFFHSLCCYRFEAQGFGTPLNRELFKHQTSSMRDEAAKFLQVRGATRQQQQL